MTNRTPLSRALAWLVIIAASAFVDACLYWLLDLMTQRPLIVLLSGNLATLLVMAFFLNIGSRMRELQDKPDNSEGSLRRRLLSIRRNKYPDVPDNLLLASEETLERLQHDADISKLANDNEQCQACNGNKTYREGMLVVTCTVCDGTGRARA